MTNLPKLKEEQLDNEYKYHSFVIRFKTEQELEELKNLISVLKNKGVRKTSEAVRYMIQCTHYVLTALDKGNAHEQ